VNSRGQRSLYEGEKARAAAHERTDWPYDLSKLSKVNADTLRQSRKVTAKTALITKYQAANL
jgi:hypothetical protein